MNHASVEHDLSDDSVGLSGIDDNAQGNQSSGMISGVDGLEASSSVVSTALQQRRMRAPAGSKAIPFVRRSRAVRSALDADASVPVPPSGKALFSATYADGDGEESKDSPVDDGLLEDGAPRHGDQPHASKGALRVIP